MTLAFKTETDRLPKQILSRPFLKIAGLHEQRKTEAVFTPRPV